MLNARDLELHSTVNRQRRDSHQLSNRKLYPFRRAFTQLNISSTAPSTTHRTENAEPLFHCIVPELLHEHGTRRAEGDTRASRIRDVCRSRRVHLQRHTLCRRVRQRFQGDSPDVPQRHPSA